MRKILMALLIGLSFTACGGGADNKERVVNAIMLAPPKPADVAEANVRDNEQSSTRPELDTSKKLIKIGEINFETLNIANTRKKILHSLASLGGYVAGENESNHRGDNQNTLALTLRIPSKSFDLLLDSISSDAEKIDSKDITIKDVTAQYIDIKTALYNKRLLEGTYQNLLKKADKISDVLQIENKLTEIRTAIDSTQGQLNYLNRQISYSTLTVNFYTRKLPQDTGYGMGYKLLSAISDGWLLLQGMFFWLIGIWPVIVGFMLLIVLLKRWFKRRRLRKNRN